MAKHNVFISCTEEDLLEYRDAVVDVVHAFDLFPICLDYPPDVGSDLVEQSISEIDQAGIFIGIYGRQYGPVISGSGQSVLEMEFERALSRHIHHLCYLADENNVPWPPAESPEAVRLKNEFRKFRMQVESAASHYEYFSTIDNLQWKVAAALRHDLSRKPVVSLDIGPYRIIDVLPPQKIRGEPALFEVPVVFESVRSVRREELRRHLGRILKVSTQEIKISGSSQNGSHANLILRTRPALRLHSMAYTRPRQVIAPTQPQAPVGREELILLIDDDPDLRQTVGDILTYENFRVEHAENGRSGLEKARTRQPDLILLDLQMPDFDGIELIERMRRSQLNIPIILMTAHGSESVAVEVFRKGVKDYLIKPVNREALLESIIQRGLLETRLRKEASQMQQRTIELTEQLRMADDSAARRLEQMRIVNMFGKTVTDMVRVEDLIERMLGAALIATASQESSLYLLQGQQLFRQATLQYGNRRADKHVEISDDPVARMVLEAGKQLILSPDEVARLERHNHRQPTAALGVPLTRSNQHIGVLVVQGRTGEHKAFTPFDAAMLTVLADYTVVALENASLLKELAPNANTLFISYDHGDWDDYVLPLATKLEAEGFNVWIDRRQILPGEDWRDKVYEALKSCPIMLLFVSPDSVNSPDVRREYRYFLHEHKPLIPIMCRSTRHLPPDLLSIQYILYDQHEMLINRVKQLMKQ